MPLLLQGDRRCGHAEAKDLGFSAFKFQTTYGKQALRAMLNFMFLSQDCKDIVLPTLEGDAQLRACALQCMQMCTYTCIWRSICHSEFLLPAQHVLPCACKSLENFVSLPHQQAYMSGRYHVVSLRYVNN
jgi:hypothetical protein